jgi:hypothetical protein
MRFESGKRCHVELETIEKGSFCFCSDEGTEALKHTGYTVLIASATGAVYVEYSLLSTAT